ncbi:MAG: acetylxylan esterase [Haliscomenobacter sp.]|uniref:alpha/beta hydrolase family protein n=1 Tax=Haliscomenobacter sp. TaxID=2717303 RepID=UPI0029AFECB1|nr:acetylxylan esterase [Haliscomenobacter sp.]MDX2067364.1 acetylxylan esterase [Haliscomenobacter sp.]
MRSPALFALLFTLLTSALLAQFNPEKPELCQRNFYTEAQAVEIHRAVAEKYKDQASWEKRAQLIRQGILDGAEIKSLSHKKPKNITIHSRKTLNGYAVENVSFQSLPGIYVTGNLYTPLEKKGKLAAILAPHGHGAEPRYKEYVQQRCATLARMGAAVFAYDMVGYGDAKYCDHKIEKAFKLQLINSTYVLNFLLSLPGVDKNRVAMSGESGGGTQTFMLAAVDERIKVAVPVVMVSGHFFGGCTCESGMPVHKRPTHITSNLEIAALFAPKPLLLISDGDDWTKNTPTFEYPFVQRIYGFYNSAANVENAHFSQEKHDYNASKRQAAYAFLAKHLRLNTAGVLKEGKFDESPNTVLTEADLKVFNEKYPMPADALKGDEVVGKALVGQVGK